MTTFISFLEYIPFWLFIRIMKLFDFNTRIFVSGKVIGFIIRHTPKYKKRVLKNLKLIYPKMSDLEKKNFLNKFSQNLGLTFSEFLFNEEYHKYQNIKFQNNSKITEI